MKRVSWCQIDSLKRRDGDLSIAIRRGCDDRTDVLTSTVSTRGASVEMKMREKQVRIVCEMIPRERAMWRVMEDIR